MKPFPLPWVPNPTDRPCLYARQCGGCQYQGIDYPRQLETKQQLAQRLLGRFGPVDPILGMDIPYHYRNKVQAAFSPDRRQWAVSGLYQPHTHRLVPVDSCQLEDQTADRIVRTIRELIPGFHLEAYDDRSRRGMLRHVLVKRAFSTGQVMVVLVTSQLVFPSRKHFVQALLERHPEITTILQSVNDRFTSMVLGESLRVLHGPGFIEDRLCGCRFRISAKSFYQVNPAQTEKLYTTALQMAGLTGRERVVDAYCGTGTIGLVASRRARQVIGVEINRDAIRDAVANARLNGIENARFLCADADQWMDRAAAGHMPVDLVFLDPPRAGCDQRLLTSLAILSPPRIVYISCNPETQARDLEFLLGKGYRVKRIQPVDMFPHTRHVETVVLLSKGEVDSKKIRVEFSLEDMDMSEFQDGATYPQIKEYVLENTGLKVSSLYISQIKRKCGLNVGQNYNLSKKEDAKVPQCPPEKEAAIMEALKHFQMT